MVWVHAAPPVLAATVREGDDRVLARGEPLRRTGAYIPMTRLELRGTRITREDRWPTDVDLGAVVILPGGEAGDPEELVERRGRERMALDAGAL